MSDLDVFNHKENPIEIVNQWCQEAKKIEMNEPLAMVLSTVGKEGPSSRVLLLKEIREDGFVFYTNYESRKGLEIAENPLACMNLFWDPLMKQIEVKGNVEKISKEESQNYWNIRPKNSQISQYISKQSEVVTDKDALTHLYEVAEKKFEERSVPCPENWGGYILKPKEIEFWIGRPFRFHDRIKYTFESGSWLKNRLYP